jgi:hypothetical protein
MRPAGRRRPSWAGRLSGMSNDLPAPALGEKPSVNRPRAANLRGPRGLSRPARHKPRPGPAPRETPGLVPGHYGRLGRSKVAPGVKGRHETRGGRAPDPSRRVSEPLAADPRVFLAGGGYRKVLGALRDGRGALVRRGVFPGRTPGPRGGTSLRYESPYKILPACPLFGAYWRRRVAFRQFILAARLRRRRGCRLAWPRGLCRRGPGMVAASPSRAAPSCQASRQALS